MRPTADCADELFSRKHDFVRTDPVKVKCLHDLAGQRNLDGQAKSGMHSLTLEALQQYSTPQSMI